MEDYKKILKEALDSKATPFEVQAWIEEHFPSLIESEDEKVRKSLLEHCRKQAEMYNTLQTTKEYNKVQSWLAWLEKQGEQKPINLVTILDDYFANTPKEQQDKDWEELKHLNNFGWELVEQKPAWTEDDEKKLLCICAWIKDYPRIADFKDEMYTVANNYIDWLKSLRPQNRWKPSEEQIKNIVELFIAWNGEDEPIDTANIDSGVAFIFDALKEMPKE